jgi:hypothetical protein
MSPSENGTQKSVSENNPAIDQRPVGDLYRPIGEFINFF